MMKKLECTLVLEIQKNTSQKTLDELIEYYTPIFDKIIITNPYNVILTTSLPIAKINKQLSISELRNSIIKHLQEKHICYLTTHEKLFLKDLPNILQEDTYYMQKVERINSQYAPDYILYRSYIYNPKKFQWVGKYIPFLQPLPQKHTLHIGQSQVRNLQGKYLETEDTKSIFERLKNPKELLVTELYYILFRGLIYSSKNTIEKVIELLDSYGNLIFKNPIAGLLIVEKLYFKIVKNHPEKARELYQKFLPNFKHLPHSYLLQATHNNLHGNKVEGEKLLQKYIHSLESLQAKDFLDLYFSEEDRFSLPYLQSLQLKFAHKDLQQIIKAGNKYFATINSHNKLKTVDKQIKENPWIKLEIENFLPQVQQNGNQKFVVISHPRSGSTLLTKLLDSHPKINMLGEILNSVPRNISEELRFPYYLERTLNQVSNIERQMNNPEQKSQVLIGSKLLFFQLDDITTIEKLIEKDYKIIYLTRHNLLDRYISSVNARHNQTYFSHDQYKIEDKILFELKNFEKFIQSCKKLNERFNIKHPSVCNISYDELVSNKDKTMAKIFSHLNLPNEVTSTKMRKQNTKDYSESIINYDEHKIYIKQYLDSVSYPTINKTR